jgi:hypothetical protein
MATAGPPAGGFAAETLAKKSCRIRETNVRARSSNWIEQGTPKPKVASSILAGRTRPRAARFSRGVRLQGLPASTGTREGRPERECLLQTGSPVC